MTARDAAERFAREGRKIPPPPFRHERAAPQQPPPRRIAPEEEETEPMYDQPRGQGCGMTIVQSRFLMCVLGLLVVLAWWAVSTGRLDAPATAEQRPTAAIEARPTSRPYPTSAAPAAAPVPTTDYGVAAYNEQQAARAAEYAQEATQEAPGATEAPRADNHEAAIEAWLAAPVSTATPLPEPGAPGFVESFEEAPECSPFIGYLPGDPCIEILKQQAGED